MAAIAFNVAPIFILILLGWAIVRIGLLKAEIGDALGQFVFMIAVPMLMLRTLADAHFEGSSPLRLWIAYFSGVLVTWTIGTMIAKYVFKRDARIGVIAGMSSSFANNIFIGLPLISRSVGDSGLVALSILIAVHLPIMMVSGTILMENAVHKVNGGASRSIVAILKQVGYNLVTNPLVIGLLAGLALNLTGLPMTPLVRNVVDQLAGMAGPAALVSLGMALTRYKISGNLGIVTATSTLKLLVMPACVLAACHLLQLRHDVTMALVLTSAVPTGVNSWLIANRFNVGQSLAASTISVTTAFGVITVSLWSWLIG
jgi:predicted permease